MLWKSLWLGIEPLSILFPDLFASTICVKDNISNTGTWSANSWIWNIRIFICSLSNRGQSQLADLSLLLQEMHLVHEINDSFIWWRDNFDFPVKDSYWRLLELHNEDIYETYLIQKDLNCLWKSIAPCKILIFGWWPLHGRLPMNEELFKRNVLSGSHNIVCPLYFNLDETVNHPFVSCSFAVEIWSNIFT